LTDTASLFLFPSSILFLFLLGFYFFFFSLSLLAAYSMIRAVTRRFSSQICLSSSLGPRFFHCNSLGGQRFLFSSSTSGTPGSSTSDKNASSTDTTAQEPPSQATQQNVGADQDLSAKVDDLEKKMKEYKVSRIYFHMLLLSMDVNFHYYILKYSLTPSV
jgi:hypothetical protein